MSLATDARDNLRQQHQYCSCASSAVMLDGGGIIAHYVLCPVAISAHVLQLNTKQAIEAASAQKEATQTAQAATATTSTADAPPAMPTKSTILSLLNARAQVCEPR